MLSQNLSPGLYLDTMHFFFVILCLYLVCSLLKSHLGFGMDFLHSGCEVFGSWGSERGFGFGPWSHFRIPPIVDLEETFPGCEVDPVVVLECSKSKPLDPVVLLMIDEDTKVLFNLLAGSLGLPIGLQMECGGYVTFDLK